MVIVFFPCFWKFGGASCSLRSLQHNSGLLHLGCKRGKFCDVGGSKPRMDFASEISGNSLGISAKVVSWGWVWPFLTPPWLAWSNVQGRSTMGESMAVLVSWGIPDVAFPVQLSRWCYEPDKYWSICVQMLKNPRNIWHRPDGLPIWCFHLTTMPASFVASWETSFGRPRRYCGGFCRQSSGCISGYLGRCYQSFPCVGSCGMVILCPFAMPRRSRPVAPWTDDKWRCFLGKIHENPL
jgi:hypothetical protein